MFTAFLCVLMFAGGCCVGWLVRDAGLADDKGPAAKDKRRGKRWTKD